MLTLSDVSASLARSVGTITTKIGRATLLPPLSLSLPIIFETATSIHLPPLQKLPGIQVSFVSRRVYIEYTHIAFVRDDKHNEKEIQVDASFKRIVNGINTK